MRILLIEDEKKLASFVKKGLQECSYAVDVSHEGEEGLHLAETNEYDLIILDILLPKIDGFTLLKELRARGVRTPVLIVSARGLVKDKVQGLDLGADDYLAKPFSFDELRARVHALLRRKGEVTDSKLKFADLTMDLLARTVTRGKTDIQLTPREFALLEFFMRHPNEVLTRTSIAEHVWDYNFDWQSNVVDVFVNYVRNKIDREFRGKLIHTIRGVGYILKDTHD